MGSTRHTFSYCKLWLQIGTPSTSGFSGKVGLRHGYFLLWSSDCMMETCMLLAGVRVHEHWWPQQKPLGWELGQEKVVTSNDLSSRRIQKLHSHKGTDGRAANQGILIWSTHKTFLKKVVQYYSLLCSTQSFWSSFDVVHTYLPTYLPTDDHHEITSICSYCMLSADCCCCRQPITQHEIQFNDFL